MKFTQRARGMVQAIAVVLSLALPLMLAVSSADARVGGGISSGSRGSRTFSAPPSTSTAPGTAQPFNRTMTQPGSPGSGAPPAAGSSISPGRGLLGGLAAGFLGAGLLGMLFGGGMFSGLGGLSSIFGLILQIGLIVIVVRMAMSWWQRRHARAGLCRRRRRLRRAIELAVRTGFGLGSGSAPLEIVPADYEAFERLLGEIQAAWSNEDVARLHTLATPEMVSYFTDDLAAEQGPKPDQHGLRRQAAAGRSRRSLARGRYRLCQRGDAVLRWSTRPSTAATGRLVEGSDQPTEATEVWTFLRPRGAKLGIVGDPAGLIVRKAMTKQGAADESAAPFDLPAGGSGLLKRFPLLMLHRSSGIAWRCSLLPSLHAPFRVLGSRRAWGALLTILPVEGWQSPMQPVPAHRPPTPDP